LEHVNAKPNVTSVPTLPMNSLWQTIRGYILWSYERGSLHYDVMVTLILLFVFLAPRFINFKDKPVERVPLQTGVLVQPDSDGGFIYQIDASAVSEKDVPIHEQLLRIIEPISGAVTISKVEEVRDHSGHLRSYKVWVDKE
jgi:hypothetical protein